MIQSIPCVHVVKTGNNTQLFLRCGFYSIYRLELLNDICALNHSLKKILEENFSKVLLYGAEESSFKTNSETLKCTIKFIQKNRSLQLSDFPLSKCLVFNSFICTFCSIYVRANLVSKLQSALFRIKFSTSTYSGVQILNSAIALLNLVPKVPFSGKFGPKTLKCFV